MKAKARTTKTKKTSRNQSVRTMPVIVAKTTQLWWDSIDSNKCKGKSFSVKPRKAEKKVVYRYYRCASAEKAAWFLTTLIMTKSNPNELTVWHLYTTTKILQLNKATKNTMKETQGRNLRQGPPPTEYTPPCVEFSIPLLQICPL